MADEPRTVKIPLPVSLPWQPPVYDEVMIRSGYVDQLCQRCGTFVADVIAHNRLHRALDQLSEALVALTSLIVPGLPPGTLLAALGTGTDITSMIRAQSGLGGSGPISVIQVGRGGGGNDSSIPTCPVCGAYGGGDHGSGCRNSGKPIHEWT